MQIDPALAEFLESGLIVLVGTRDASLVPEVVRGNGVFVTPDREAVSVFVSRAAAGETLPNLRDNARIAVTFGCPLTFRCLQLKGRCNQVGEPDPDELEPLVTQWRALTRRLVQAGAPAEYARRIELPELLRIRFAVQELYDQTPGPRAGERL